MKKAPPPDFSKILEDKRKAHAADLKRIAENFEVLKKRVASIKDDLPEVVDYDDDAIDEVNFWLNDTTTGIPFSIQAGPFGFAVDGTYCNLEVGIGLLAKWIAENEGDQKDEG